MKRKDTTKQNALLPIDPIIPFWKKWLAADQLKREELTGQLRLFETAESLRKMKDRKLARYSFTSFLNSYFNDLEDAVLITAEGKKKR